MSDSQRRKIERLRALAASSTFPAEAESARAKADQLEAALGGPVDDHGPDARAAFQPRDPAAFQEMVDALRRQMEERFWTEMMGGAR